MKKTTKLKWKEMNKKQRICFVIDWVCRGILIALLAVILIAGFVSCIDGCGKDKSSTVAYADSCDEFIMPYAEESNFNFSNSVLNFTYNFSGSFYQCIIVDIPVGVNITCELNIKNAISNKVTLNPVMIVNPWGDRTPFSWINDNLYVCSFIPTVSSYQFLIDWSGKDPSLTELLGSVYFYYGDYVPGFGQGLAAGIEQGKAEGSEIAQYGVFQDATVDAVFTYADDSKLTVTELTPDFLYQGIYLKSVWDKYWFKGSDSNTLESVEATINFKSSFLYKNSIPFVQGCSDILSFIFTDVSGNKYSGDFLFAGSDMPFSYVPGQTYVEDLGVEGAISVVSMKIFMGRAYDTLQEFSLTQVDGNYYGGYTNGYNEGKNDGEVSGYIKGEAAGYEKGHYDGYQEGFNLAADGGFGWLISSVQQFLDTKFFGDFGIGTLVYVSLGVVLVMFFLKVVSG